jgi:hypothetical protein
MRRLLSPLLVLALLCGPAAAQQFSSLEERMSAKEFKEAGLDKLTPEELAKLNAWLAGRTQPAGTAAAPVEDRRGFLSSGSAADETAIVSRILGEFRGWREKGDRFVLENGQVWQISDYAPKFVVRMQDPVVRIEPGAFSAWFLSVDGYNAKVKVRRIK